MKDIRKIFNEATRDEKILYFTYLMSLLVLIRIILT